MTKSDRGFRAFEFQKDCKELLDLLSSYRKSLALVSESADSLQRMLCQSSSSVEDGKGRESSYSRYLADSPEVMTVDDQFRRNPDKDELDARRSATRLPFINKNSNSRVLESIDESPLENSDSAASPKGRQISCDSDSSAERLWDAVPQMGL
eukprot:TRINITY_DN41652_c0_g1_i1.p1 TRINITY_DN41652_c0_g1~~TRINITY_DN41652_c0_g1_i1.p1  ORF type:complete len:152 (+),score=21.32 TRINITY_DN41652_c0_g1_i1:95-550(+)